MHVLHLHLQTLVLIWFVFGACVKPELYLAYAAAAVSFVTFITAKASNMQSLQKELQSAIIEFTKVELQTLLAESKAISKELAVDKILHGGGVPFSTDDFNVATATMNNLISTSQSALKQFGFADLDLQTISRVLALDQDTLTAVGLKWEIHPDILSLIIAGARRNETDAINAMTSLCHAASINFQPVTIAAILKLVKCIVNMRTGKFADALSSQVAFDLALKELVNLILSSDCVQTSLTKFTLQDHCKFADVEHLKQFLGHAVDAFLSLLKVHSQSACVFDILRRFSFICLGML
jgi:hypothetical protein